MSVATVAMAATVVAVPVGHAAAQGDEMIGYYSWNWGKVMYRRFFTQTRLDIGCHALPPSHGNLVDKALV